MSDENVTPPPAPEAAAPEAPHTDIPKDQRTMGMLCHLLALAGFLIPFGNIIGPLVIWLIKKEEMPFVNDQGKESLNFQISLIIVAIALFVLSLIPFVFCITAPLLLVLVVVDLIFIIMGTIKSNDGIAYRYPFALRLIK